MEKQMIFDEKMKARMGIICFIPILCFLTCFVYYLCLVVPALARHHAVYTVVTITSRNYDTLFVMLASSAIITAPVFIYCLVILARFRHMHAATKLEWIIFLSVLAPIASALFWIFLIKDSPKYVGVYPDIT